MPKEFTRNFAKNLDRISKIKVKEAKNGDKLWGGTCSSRWI
ncbi:chemotaxis protein CheB [Halonatronum saccharophilum]